MKRQSHADTAGRFSPIAYAEIPGRAREGLLYRTQLYTDPRQGLNMGKIKFSRYIDSAGDERVETFLASSRRHCIDGTSEDVVELVDAASDGSLIGAGEVVKPIGLTPHVGWTATDERRRGEGLGRRRLLIMNLASHAIFDEALHSDLSIQSLYVHQMWQRLIEKGVAYSYDNDSGQRYAFFK